MADDEAPEDRLEAALERIARIVDSSRSAVAAPVAAPGQTAELGDRLDRIIDTLREALGQ